MEKRKTCRCPACNPLHIGGSHKGFGFRSMNAFRGVGSECLMCKGTKLVLIEDAERYISLLNKENELTARPTGGKKSNSP